MDRSTLMRFARAHWQAWLPARVAELRAAGEFGENLQAVAARAQRDIQDLMRQGYQEHEAAEVVLPQLVLLPPEPGTELDDDEREELAELDREYQRLMRD